MSKPIDRVRAQADARRHLPAPQQSKKRAQPPRQRGSRNVGSEASPSTPGNLGVAFRARRHLGAFGGSRLRCSPSLAHSHQRRGAADARRDRVLARLGYRVLRLEAELVLRHPASAVARIRAALASCRC